MEVRNEVDMNKDFLMERRKRKKKHNLLDAMHDIDRENMDSIVELLLTKCRK
jgi:antitoxin component of MazEF toxin-antitoxin module